MGFGWTPQQLIGVTEVISPCQIRGLTPLRAVAVCYVCTAELQMLTDCVELVT